MASKHVLRRIKREFSVEKPTLWIGRNGVTSDLVEEAQRQLERREIVKIRLQRSVAQSTEQVAKLLVVQTGAEVADLRGRSFILYSPPKREWKPGENTENVES